MAVSAPIPASRSTVAGAAVPQTGGAAVAVHGGRIERLRSRLLLALIAGGCLALLGAVVVFAANTVTTNRYNRIVQEGATSVDAALDARAAILDNAGANADLLTETGDTRNATRALATKRYEDFKEDLRRSWRNRSDRTQGEFAVFDAADRASTDYAAAIGAMDAAIDANRPDDARAAFLNGYTVLTTRLLPALGGLESVKVEFMKSAYGSTSTVIRGWLTAVAAVSAALALVILAGFGLSRRMHRRFTAELVLALVLVIAIGIWVGIQLRRADTQARVLVRDAYDTVAGVRDEIALLSQEKALQSIAIFDPAAAGSHFNEFDDYNLQFEQGLCGAADCSRTGFLAGTDVAATVKSTALDNQDRFGLPRTPLIANVHFAGEARALESARAHYQNFLRIDRDLRAQVQSGNTATSVATNDGVSRTEFSATAQQLDSASGAARTVYDRIRHSVVDAASIGAWLAAGEIAAALLLVRGLWRRRQELYIAR